VLTTSLLRVEVVVVVIMLAAAVLVVFAQAPGFL